MKPIRLITIVCVFLISLHPIAAFSAGPLPAFFQGFEVNTSGWYPYPYSQVDRVTSPDQSVTYNSGVTSQYGNAPINAATGGFFGRVTSAVSSSATPEVGSCSIESVPGGAGLRCIGPYTYFGIKSGPAVPYPVGSFPPDGFTTQVDIYLDQDYAARHQDCGLFGPCTPLSDPPVLNPACATGPNGIECEGTRFNWTVGISRPYDNDATSGADYLQDYVFSVGTAPKHASQFDPSNPYCASGWIITAGYNSFRSGGDYYNPAKEPMCLSGSGWYTFKQVFKDVGGQLVVDYFVLDSNGDPAQCTDPIAPYTSTTCQWTLTPGQSISQVGCPRYGWLANEEINDLPIDNTALFIRGCGMMEEGELQGQITPTNTTCQMYADGTAATLGQLAYTTMKKEHSKINAVSPGVFFYYTTISGEEGDAFTFTQSHTGIAPDIQILKSDVKLWSTTCSQLSWESLTVNPDGTATGTLPKDGSFIVGVKYNPSSLKGKPVPDPEDTTYIFGTSGNGIQNPAAIDLVKKH